MKLLLFSLTAVIVITLADAWQDAHSPTAVISRPVSDFNMWGAVLKQYKIITGMYPTQEQGLKALVEKPENFPPDKRWTQLADTIPLDPWGKPYQYIAPTTAEGEYGLYSFGRDGISLTNGNDPDDRNNWTPSAQKTKSIMQRWNKSNKAFIIGVLLLIIAVIRWLFISFNRMGSRENTNA
jgi:general secretion pathway protein G